MKVAEMADVAEIERKRFPITLPKWPLVVWIVLVTVGLGMAGGLDAQSVISTFNAGFGRALGEFALILLPSFTLAACLSRYETGAASGIAAAAAWALWMVPDSERTAAFESAVRRTGSLLLMIGAAGAFGAVLTHLVPVGEYFSTQGGLAGVLSLFVLTAAFKLAQGSSMATFAAVAPVAAPIVAASEMSPVAAVLAICIGSFIAILPNDSFYWLVRRDALAASTEGASIIRLAGGALIQAGAGLAVLTLIMVTGLI